MHWDGESTSIELMDLGASAKSNQFLTVPVPFVKEFAICLISSGGRTLSHRLKPVNLNS